MLCFILVIGFIQPFILAQDAAGGNKSTVACDIPEVRVASENVFHCFNDIIMYGNQSHATCRVSVEEYVKVASQHCYKETRSRAIVDKGVTEFVNLVEYSIKNGEFHDFVNNSGVECLVALNDQIQKCVKEFTSIVIEADQASHYPKYEHLWKMTSFTIDAESCRATNRIERCVQKAMRDDGYNKCKHGSNIVLYVGSLFEYMLDRCSRVTPEWNNLNQPMLPPPPRSKKMEKDMRTTHVLLGVLLAVAILAIFYVCVRDCRAPRGPWKAMNERISMSILKRRKSLVNNEYQEGN